jgi:hypothetical protein
VLAFFGLGSFGLSRGWSRSRSRLNLSRLLLRLLGSWSWNRGRLNLRLLLGVMRSWDGSGDKFHFMVRSRSGSRSLMMGMAALGLGTDVLLLRLVDLMVLMLDLVTDAGLAMMMDLVTDVLLLGLPLGVLMLGLLLGVLMLGFLIGVLLFLLFLLFKLLLLLRLLLGLLDDNDLGALFMRLFNLRSFRPSSFRGLGLLRNNDSLVSMRVCLCVRILLLFILLLLFGLGFFRSMLGGFRCLFSNLLTSGSMGLAVPAARLCPVAITFFARLTSTLVTDTSRTESRCVGGVRGVEVNLWFMDIVEFLSVKCVGALLEVT